MDWSGWSCPPLVSNWVNPIEATQMKNRTKNLPFFWEKRLGSILARRRSPGGGEMAAPPHSCQKFQWTGEPWRGATATVRGACRGPRHDGVPEATDQTPEFGLSPENADAGGGVCVCVSASRAGTSLRPMDCSTWDFPGRWAGCALLPRFFLTQGLSPGLSDTLVIPSLPRPWLLTVIGIVGSPR